MKILFRTLFIFIAFVLQVTVLKIGNLWGIQPDFLLILLTWLALSSDRTRAVEYGFLLGFGQDVFSGGPMGLNTLVKMMIGFFNSGLRKNIIFDNSANRTIVVMLNTLIQVLLIGGICSLLSLPISIGDIIDRKFFYQLLSHGILSLPIMWAMDKFG